MSKKTTGNIPIVYTSNKDEDVINNYIDKPNNYNKLEHQENRCPGKSEDGTYCRYLVKEGYVCCTRAHSDMEKYTQEMFDNMQICKTCPRPRWRYLIDNKYCEKCNLVYCLGRDSDGGRCRLKKGVNLNYCSRNHAFMNEYTPEMIQNLKYCKGCKKWRYEGHFDGNMLCSVVCQKRGKFNRDKKRDLDKKTKKKCQNMNCDNYAQENKNFCGIHELDQLVIDAKCNGMKLCVNYNRKCEQPMLPEDYPYSKCENCRNNSNIKDKKERDLYFEMRKCRVCGDTIEGNNTTDYLCDIHKINKSQYDRNRVKDDTETNESRIKEYKRQAIKRNKIFDISDEQLLTLFLQNCHYCNIYVSSCNKYGETYSKMGIDRKDNDIGYVDGNVLPCCHICNRMKYNYEYDNFFRYLHNIFKNFGAENPREKDPNIKVVPYKKHKTDAKNNGRPSELTETEYNNITLNKCYYCDCMNSYQLNIDRVDSILGYTNKNKLVSCCSICNIMKSDTNVDEFYNKIITILLFHKYIDNNTYDNNKRNIKRSSSRIKQVNDAICKIYDYNGKENRDRRNIHQFEHPSQYYINQIWTCFDIRRFKPELEFCESKEQISTWMFYRLAISSHYPNKYSPLDTLILIRDKFTKKYVAFASLTMIRGTWVGSTKLSDIVRNKNIYNISTCVAIPPFSFNFCGGKLVTMLMFSKEVYEYMNSKGKLIAGLMTYSLHGNSAQYENLDNFNFICYSKNTTGKDNIRVPSKVYNAMIKIMKKKGYPITGSKPYNIKTYCAEQGLMDASKHGVIRAIYFGTMGGNSTEFLRGNTGVHVPDLILVDEISNIWYVTYVHPRICELIKRNNFMTEYNYDTYYVDKSGYNRNRKNLSLLKMKTSLRQKEEQKIQILKVWFENQTKTWTELTELVLANITTPMITINRIAIQNYILQHTYENIDDISSNEIDAHITKRYNLLEKSKHSVDLMKRVDTILSQEHRYINNSINDPVPVFVKKPRFFITTQHYADIKVFDRLTNIEGIKKGLWYIYPKQYSDVNHKRIQIVSLEYSEYDTSKNYDVKTIQVNSSRMIFKIGLGQTDKTFKLSDISILDANIKITGKDNIFIDIAKYNISNTMEIILYSDDNDNSYCKVDIYSKNTDHNNGTQCTCDECILLISNKLTQRSKYRNEYIKELGQISKTTNDRKTCVNISDWGDNKCHNSVPEKIDNKDTHNNSCTINAKKLYDDQNAEVDLIMEELQKLQ